ncbi:MAG: hypothetical protein D6766_12100 [Verrucomicrobia bacterium]|nr:MAG: hypothetical protein D6766_12100 [Verrucomicrobiota bacterium]
MISLLRGLVDVAIKLFALGLFAAMLLEWFAPPGLQRVTAALKAFYERFLAPIRRHVRPFRLSRSAPAAIDPAPWILLLLVWWIVHPFLMWVLS